MRGEREKRERGRERSSCYSQGTSEDPQQVWAGSEQEASRALQRDRERGEKEGGERRGGGRG